MKLTFENLKTPINGRIPALEIARATGTNVGDPGSRRYKAWEITFDGKEHVEVKAPKWHENSFQIWLVNGDVDVYVHDTPSNSELTTTDNQALIYCVYFTYGFEIEFTEKEKELVGNIFLT